ncbi:MAG: hypothetical protein CMO19_03955 [Thaumarchaeota archaeon]|nr:hypothetical protein [Nitrososphaerota archaeon]
MPEIWIPYGDVEISVDINADNLSGIYKIDNNNFDIDELNNNQILTNIEEKINIFDICNSAGSLSIIEKLIEMMNKEDNNYELEIISRRFQKREIEELFKNKKINFNIKFIEDLSKEYIIEFLNNKQTILLSNSSFDGLFGFSGGSITLSKIINKNLIKNAFYDKEVNLPESGIISNRTNIILKEFRKYNNIISIQIIEDSTGINDCIIGNLEDVYKIASNKLMDNVINTENMFESCIISCDYKKINTLNNSLNGIWNIYKSIEKKGHITLISESSNGFGSDALNKFAINKINVKEYINNNDYIENLENLIFLENIHENYSIDIVSTIPHYYIEKRLKFRPHNTVNSALNSAIRRKGKMVKIAIVPNGNNTIIKHNQIKTI